MQAMIVLLLSMPAIKPGTLPLQGLCHQGLALLVKLLPMTGKALLLIRV